MRCESKSEWNNCFIKNKPLVIWGFLTYRVTHVKFFAPFKEVGRFGLLVYNQYNTFVWFSCLVFQNGIVKAFAGFTEYQISITQNDFFCKANTGSEKLQLRFILSLTKWQCLFNQATLEVLSTCENTSVTCWVLLIL